MDALKSKVLVIIPCLNEGRTIASLVCEVRTHTPNVLVIDDGSTDDTTQAAIQAGAEVIRHSMPQGKGASLKEGWTWAFEHHFACVIFMDGDGQHAPSDLPRFLQALEQGKRFVIGNRFHSPEKMPWLRRRVNQWMSRKLSTLAGHALPDSQCGFRLVNTEDLMKAKVHATHFEIESEMVVKLAQMGVPPHFVPIDVIYRTEKSKIRPWRDTVRWFRWLRKWPVP